MKWLLVLFAAFAFTASAADIAGTWKASTETPNGTFETTFVFKVDGTTLTGSTTNQMMGEKAISEGNDPTAADKSTMSRAAMTRWRRSAKAAAKPNASRAT